MEEESIHSDPERDDSNNSEDSNDSSPELGISQLLPNSEEVQNYREKVLKLRCELKKHASFLYLAPKSAFSFSTLPKALLIFPSEFGKIVNPEMILVYLNESILVYKDKFFQILTKFMQRVKNIERFIFKAEFMYIPVEVNPADCQKVTSMLLSQTNLKELNLKLFNEEKELEWVDNLHKCLKRNSSLEVIKLDFNYTCWLQNSHFCKISSAIRDKKYLRVLFLDFQNARSLTDKSVYHLADTLDNFPQLEGFYIGFRYVNISFDSTNALMTRIGRMKQLKELYLIFEHCDEIGNLGISFMTKTIQEMPQLVKLTINFDACCNVSPEEFHLIVECLPRLENLEWIFLDFRTWPITDSDLQKLGDVLKTMKKLKSFEHNLDHCNYISEEGMNKFYEVLNFIRMKNFE